MDEATHNQLVRALEHQRETHRPDDRFVRQMEETVTRMMRRPMQRKLRLVEPAPTAAPRGATGFDRACPPERD